MTLQNRAKEEDIIACVTMALCKIKSDLKDFCEDNNLGSRITEFLKYFMTIFVTFRDLDQKARLQGTEVDVTTIKQLKLP